MKLLAILTGTPRKAALAALAAVLLLASAPAAVPVYAQGPTPQPRGAAVVERILVRLYEREQAWLKAQANHLERAGQVADKAQQLLDAAKEKGKDVVALEQALAAFRFMRARFWAWLALSAPVARMWPWLCSVPRPLMRASFALAAPLSESVRLTRPWRWVLRISRRTARVMVCSST